MSKLIATFDTLLAYDTLQKMKGFDQRNPHHCYDLYDHTMATVEGVGDNQLLRIASLLHDVGKPACAMEKYGNLVFYGHAQKSAEMAREMLYGYMQSQEIDFIAKLIEHHDDFINFKLESEYDSSNPYFVLINEDNLINWQAENDFSNEEVFALLGLCRADAGAQSEHVFNYKGVELVGCSRKAKVEKIDYIQSVFSKAWASRTVDGNPTMASQLKM